MAGRKKTTKGYTIPAGRLSAGPGVRTREVSAKEFGKWMNSKMRDVK